MAKRTAYLEFLATSGEAKFQGSRVPMRWCIPKTTITGVNVAKAIKKFMKDREDALEGADFWLPDFGPARTGLADVDCFEGAAMPIGRFRKLSLELFASYGAGPEELASISTYLVYNGGTKVETFLAIMAKNRIPKSKRFLP